MIKNLVKKLASFLNPFHFVMHEGLGKPFKVVKNTIRDRQDKDDAWWFLLAKQHKVIFDIGSNVGYMSFLALMTDPNRRMLLVDPNHKALQVAALNFMENGFGQHVSYYPSFVSDVCEKKVKFYTVGTGAAGSMYASHAQTAASQDSYFYSKTVTLDFLYGLYDLKPDLVKIDVEGAEYQVMQGAKNLAKETQCSFFVEMHSLKKLSMEGHVQLMLDWCDEMNYRAWYVTSGCLLLNTEPLKNRGKCHLLLMPLHIKYPDYLKGVKPYTAIRSLL